MFSILFADPRLPGEYISGIENADQVLKDLVQH